MVAARILGPYGYTHRELYYHTPYDVYRRLLSEAKRIESDLKEG